MRSYRRTAALAAALALLLSLVLGVVSASAATPTSLALTVTPTAPEYAKTVAAKATVTPASPGTVSFYLDGNYVTTVGLNGQGKASATIPLGNASLGSHTVSASYNPAAPLWDPSGDSVPITVVPAQVFHVTWVSMNTAYLFGPPSGTVNYNAAARYDIPLGGAAVARFVFRDADTGLVACDVPASGTMGPLIALGGCTIPLQVGTHHLTVEAAGNYTSAPKAITVKVIAFP